MLRESQSLWDTCSIEAGQSLQAWLCMHLAKQLLTEKVHTGKEDPSQTCSEAERIAGGRGRRRLFRLGLAIEVHGVRKGRRQ